MNFQQAGFLHLYVEKKSSLVVINLTCFGTLNSLSLFYFFKYDYHFLLKMTVNFYTNVNVYI